SMSTMMWVAGGISLFSCARRFVQRGPRPEPSTASRVLKLRRIDRQLAQTLAGGGEQRVRDRGGDGGGSRLAYPARELRAFDDVHLNDGRLIHAQDLVGVEVGLFDTPVLQRDSAEKSGRDPEDHCTLNLRLHVVRIHDRAAVDRADDAPDADSAILRDLDFG